MAVVSHLALDGSRHEVEADLDLTRPFTSVVDIGVAGRRYEFTAGAANLGDEVAGALGVSFTEELSYDGGTLLIGRGSVTDPRSRLADDVTVATWRGRRFSLVVSLYNVSTADVLDVLGSVRITEHPDGIELAPAPGSPAQLLGGALVLKEVPGLGLLEISGRTRDSVRELPSWAGLRVPAGELFQDKLSNGQPYFVLAAPAAVVAVLPLADTTIDAVPTLLSTLRVAVRTAQRW